MRGARARPARGAGGGLPRGGGGGGAASPRPVVGRVPVARGAQHLPLLHRLRTRSLPLLPCLSLRTCLHLRPRLYTRNTRGAGASRSPSPPLPPRAAAASPALPPPPSPFPSLPARLRVRPHPSARVAHALVLHAHPDARRQRGPQLALHPPPRGDGRGPAAQPGGIPRSARAHVRRGRVARCGLLAGQPSVRRVRAVLTLPPAARLAARLAPPCCAQAARALVAGGRGRALRLRGRGRGRGQGREWHRDGNVGGGGGCD
ncbi:hypothetical protein T492DRAFT_530751 [Pavlovales sp. CCMP2436]|nr:hypothetical protein T492DRAFT_530751 [Pavlovales sp. CCMP2436]